MKKRNTTRYFKYHDMVEAVKPCELKDWAAEMKELGLSYIEITQGEYDKLSG